MNPFSNDNFLLRYRRKELTFDFLLILGSAVTLTLVSYLFSAIALTNDRLLPFHSVSFTLGVAAVAYYSMQRSLKFGLYLAWALLLVIGMVWYLYTPMSFTAMAIHFVLVGIFLASVCILPNILPWIQKKDMVRLASKNKELEPRLTELREQVQKLEKQETIERAATDRKEQIKLTSRITFLNAFAREVLQASSNRELLNLLFHNLMKLLQPEECLLLIPSAETSEVIVTRALHAEHEKLENSRIPYDNPLLAKVLKDNQPVSSVPPLPLVPGVVSRFIFAILEEEKVVAIYNVGLLKGGDLLPEDQELVLVMSSLISGAVEQLKISSQTA